MVKALLGAGASPVATDEAGWTACERAVVNRRACNLEVVRTLLSDPAVHLPPYKPSRPPPSLHPPCVTGNVCVLKLFVARGGLPDQPHPGPLGSEAAHAGWLPIHTACRHGRLAAARFLLDQGLATAKQRDRRGNTALHSLFETDFGSLNAKVQLVTVLVQKGADVRAKNKDGYEAMHISRDTIGGPKSTHGVSLHKALRRAVVRAVNVHNA
mmetsp:Transcript_7743/g.14588  ORF Transcript_7743/g.14588 Transcript_7743/m.14588 type:complete len:212 (+) Transcript_7743:233-868(+)